MLTMTGATAQKKLFDQALRQGRAKGSFYKATNNKRTIYELSKMNAYAKNRNYLTGENKMRLSHRFGDIATTVAWYEFLPKSEYDSYVCEKMTSGKTLKDFSAEGTALMYTGDGETPFSRTEKVKWTGTLSSGHLDGAGDGFVKASDGKYYSFKGTFKQGLPQGKTTFKEYTGKQGLFDDTKLTTRTADMGKQDEAGLTYLSTKNGFGFVDQSGKFVIKPAFDAVKTGFTGGEATVTYKGVDMKIDTKGEVKQILSSNIPNGFFSGAFFANKMKEPLHLWTSEDNNSIAYVTDDPLTESVFDFGIIIEKGATMLGTNIDNLAFFINPDALSAEQRKTFDNLREGKAQEMKMTFSDGETIECNVIRKDVLMLIDLRGFYQGMWSKSKSNMVKKLSTVDITQFAIGNTVFNLKGLRTMPSMKKIIDAVGRQFDYSFDAGF